MHKFWSWLGLNLGRHWVVVLLVGGVLTVVLGYGTTKLEFSTGQSNYLNKTDQVYKDNVAYQDLFGGQAMITLVTMDPGHTVAELFTPSGIEQWKAQANQIQASHKALDVVTPLDRAGVERQPHQEPERRPHPERRGQDPRCRPVPRAVGARARRRATPTPPRRSNASTAIPLAARTVDNPKYLDFLLYDNQHRVRKPLLAFFPDRPPRARWSCG